jgi:hypothetical protein
MATEVGKEGRATNRLEPRGLSSEEAAALAARHSRCFMIGCGETLPGQIPGTHRWVRKAIDAALDRASRGSLPKRSSAKLRLTVPLRTHDWPSGTTWRLAPTT